jgi:excisionase family DNA binding protein
VANDEPWITTEEAAAWLSKPPSWLQNNVVRLGIPHAKCGRQYRFRRSDLDAWMQAQAAA